MEGKAMSDTREPLVPYVKNFGGVFQGEEDFRPCYLASAVDPLLEEVEKVRLEIAALFSVPSDPTFEQAITVCRGKNTADAHCLLAAMDMLNDLHARLRA